MACAGVEERLTEAFLRNTLIQAPIDGKRLLMKGLVLWIHNVSIIVIVPDKMVVISRAALLWTLAIWIEAKAIQR